MRLTPPRWIAHRGGGFLAPENTLAGIRLAARLGYRAVEFDVMLSADGTPVLIHDETLERTTDGCGRVADTPDPVLFALDAGQGERIPRLEEALALCAELGLLANVEIKPSRGLVRETADAVLAACRKALRDDRTQLLISSFEPEALALAQVLLPEVPRALLFGPVPDDWQARLQAVAAVYLHCAAEHLSDAVLRRAAKSRIPILCYTVDEPAAAHALFERGVSSLFTDNLAVFSGETKACEGLHLPG